MIGFNIYDDYYDDGHVPQGECQETWGHAEFGADGEEEDVASVVYAYVSLLYLPGVSLSLDGEDITFKHLTHELREQLLEWLQKSDLKFKDKEIDFYSES